jgi:hypothetical protein
MAALWWPKVFAWMIGSSTDERRHMTRFFVVVNVLCISNEGMTHSQFVGEAFARHKGHLNVFGCVCVFYLARLAFLSVRIHKAKTMQGMRYDSFRMSEKRKK